jgi:hypothetical protein
LEIIFAQAKGITVESKENNEEFGFSYISVSLENNALYSNHRQL